jgi:hypothetical protein
MDQPPVSAVSPSHTAKLSVCVGATYAYVCLRVRRGGCHLRVRVPYVAVDATFVYVCLTSRWYGWRNVRDVRAVA